MRSFYTDLDNRLSAEIDKKVKKILYGHFGRCDITQNLINENDLGVDYRLKQNGHIFNFDLKVRDWALSKSEDIVLEIKSNRETGKVGWSLDKSKLTHYVLWYFKQDDQHYLAKFKDILIATEQNKIDWVMKYGRVQWTNTGSGYSSLSAFVPIKEFETAVFWSDYE